MRYFLEERDVWLIANGSRNHIHLSRMTASVARRQLRDEMVLGETTREVEFTLPHGQQDGVRYQGSEQVAVARSSRELDPVSADLERFARVLGCEPRRQVDPGSQGSLRQPVRIGENQGTLQLSQPLTYATDRR